MKHPLSEETPSGTPTRVDALPHSLPPVRVPHPHVEVRPDLLAGSPVVRGSRVPVRRLWDWHRKGVAVETLVKRYSSLGWARILSALAFAYDNRELVDADLERERALLEATEDEAPPFRSLPLRLPRVAP